MIVTLVRILMFNLIRVEVKKKKGNRVIFNVFHSPLILN